MGSIVGILHEDKGGFKYVLQVRVLESNATQETLGQVERVFAAGIGEVTGGEILDFIGQRITFCAGDILPII